MTSPGYSSLFGFLALSAAVLVSSEASEKAQHGGQHEVPISLIEKTRGSLNSELPGFSTHRRSHPKTIEISSFAFRVGNTGKETGSRHKRSRWSGRDGKLHTIFGGQELPLVILQPSRDSDAVRKKVFGSGFISDLFNNHHMLPNDQLVKDDMMPRKGHKKSDVNPFFVIMHRHLNNRSNSEKALVAPVENSSLTEQRRKTDNETEARVRSAEFAINVLKRAIMNKMLKSSRSGDRTQPCKNVSSPVLGVPVVDLQNSIREGDAAKVSTSDTASFELSYEVKMVKFDDGQRWQDDLLAYGSQSRQATDTSMAYVVILVMTMVALPVAIAGFLRMIGFYFRILPKNPCRKTCTAIVPASGTKTRKVNIVGSHLDEPISITVNSYCAAPKTRAKSANPPKLSVV